MRFGTTSVQGQQDFEVDLSGLTPGVYIYQVQTGEETEHIKIIKQ